MFEITPMVKHSEQPYTESCVANWRQALRSVDRKGAGRIIMRKISPEIHGIEVADCLGSTGRQNGVNR